MRPVGRILFLLYGGAWKPLVFVSLKRGMWGVSCTGNSRFRVLDTGVPGTGYGCKAVGLTAVRPFPTVWSARGRALIWCVPGPTTAG